MKQVSLLLILAVLWLLPSCQPSSGAENGDMVLIPAGEFQLGMPASDNIPAFMSDRTSSANAQPMQNLHLDAFYIDRNEVTYADFLAFKPSARYAEGRANHPVRGISWYEADAYCLWLGKRLPTEFEWEKAARGDDGRLFVWGNELDKSKANFGKTPQPVGSVKTDVSVYGVQDMNGNVSEWTASWYQPYPNSNHQDSNFGENFKVIRGGAYNKREHGFMEQFAMIPYRNVAPPTMRTWNTGFRCARSIPKAESGTPG
ncbi:formylglycine-generating enzyme required for sulfatase activity [Nitrospina gracilis Nb-211]|nr:formylglycine-generating enzyme required for sulfatase activity [Nitrospina gracilis Nb-211]